MRTARPPATIVVALGSVPGTIQDAVDEMRDAGVLIGVLAATTSLAVAIALIAGKDDIRRLRRMHRM